MRNLNPIYLHEGKFTNLLGSGALALTTLLGFNGLQAGSTVVNRVQPQLRRVVQDTSNSSGNVFSTMLSNIVNGVKNPVTKKQIQNLSMSQVDRICDPATLYTIILKSSDQKALQILKSLNKGTAREVLKYAKSGGYGFVPTISSVRNANRLEKLLGLAGFGKLI